MAKNITRRQAAKAITLGTAAALVAPAALAATDPDAEILALAREIEHIETVIIPPLAKAHDEAEALANDVAEPCRMPPRLTLEQIDAEEAKSLARYRGDSGASKILCAVYAKKFPGVDPERAIKELYADDREAVRQYDYWRAARLKAEEKTGLHEKEQRHYRAHDEADAIREKICSIPAHTGAGYRIKLQIAMDGLHPDTIAAPEYVTDKALISLMRDLGA